MKFLLVLMVALLLVPVLAFGGPDRAAIFDDCAFWRSAVGAAVTADTLWFTATQANTASTAKDFDGLSVAELSARTAPQNVPIGSRTGGSLVMAIMPVKKLLLYSRVPFTYRAFQPGFTPRTWHDIVDTLSNTDANRAGNGYILDKFPCWAVIAYPDSIYIAEAGGDSVQVDVGF